MVGASSAFLPNAAMCMSLTDDLQFISEPSTLGQELQKGLYIKVDVCKPGSRSGSGSGGKPNNTIAIILGDPDSINTGVGDLYANLRKEGVKNFFTSCPSSPEAGEELCQYLHRYHISCDPSNFHSTEIYATDHSQAGDIAELLYSVYIGIGETFPPTVFYSTRSSSAQDGAVFKDFACKAQSDLDAALDALYKIII